MNEIERIIDRDPSERIIDRDPSDETTWQNHQVTPETGLCDRPYCDDLALPGEEYCRDCLREIMTWEAEIIDGF